MSFLGKVYDLERNENFEEYIKSLDLSAETADLFLKTKPSIKLVKNGDTYTLTSFCNEFRKELKFKSG
ncbi:unnamed protein product [Leptidea sinapis]|uniref:Cytosolic fatty-acid binding proteins domain-containing protein n=2 Tax=Leptidea sinapis TaxID=189913 RepID=A0A5E4QEX4_9NEOP|nr:unnamed protein product [Leptidea sinapis]